MIENLNNNKNKLLIKITKNCDFVYLEETIKIDSPVNQYYFKYNDLSINLTIRLKWSLHAYFFMFSIKETLNDPLYTDELNFDQSINSFIKFNNKKILTVDEIEFSNIEDFTKEMETEYIQPLYTENSIIHFKLMVNIDEFVLWQNILIPALIYYKSSDESLK